MEHAGKISSEVAKALAHERYQQFDTERRQAERIATDEADLQDIEALQQSLDRKPE